MTGPVLQPFSPDSVYAHKLQYRYRYCPRCCQEWPAKHTFCPHCVHWLGDRPLERTEWQLAPRRVEGSLARSHELIGTSAVVLRVVSGRCPSEVQRAALGRIIRESLSEVGTSGAVFGVGGHGWLIWTSQGLRRAFRLACAVQQRIAGAVPLMEQALAHTAPVRWGIWSDQLILPFDLQNGLVMSDVTAHAIFDFEPEDTLVFSESAYQANRRWENFVCVSRQLLTGADDSGYRLVGHKPSSALDHAKVRHASPFVGRQCQLSIIDECWRSAGSKKSLAVIAEAGSGKTRLIGEWLARHSSVRALGAGFSLFGGDVESVAGQLAELPPDHRDHDALVQAVADRVDRENVDVLIFDDLHWAQDDGIDFISRLLDRLSDDTRFFVFASRPSGWQRVRALRPAAELVLEPLPSVSSQDLASRLIEHEAVARTAATRSKGNPLFIEQFSAWAAETHFVGGEDGPHTLYQVIAARIAYLSDMRLKGIQDKLRWGGSWERQIVQGDLARLETEIGLWLDRLETGDYADRVGAARHLSQLERLDYNIWLTGTLAGRPQSRSSRLREATERLLLGSAEAVLADLKRRAAEPSVLRENIAREAEHAGDVLSSAFQWSVAREFYELVRWATPALRDQVWRRLEQCQAHSRACIRSDGEVQAADHDLEERPSVTALDLPYIWADLGRRHSSAEYFRRAAHAAECINDQALAAWARSKATPSSAATAGSSSPASSGATSRRLV